MKFVNRLPKSGLGNMKKITKYRKSGSSYTATGEVEYAKVEYSDGATQTGTPFNAASMNAITDDILSIIGGSEVGVVRDGEGIVAVDTSQYDTLISQQTNVGSIDGNSANKTYVFTPYFTAPVTVSNRYYVKPDISFSVSSSPSWNTNQLIGMNVYLYQKTSGADVLAWQGLFERISTGPIPYQTVPPHLCTIQTGDQPQYRLKFEITSGTVYNMVDYVNTATRSLDRGQTLTIYINQLKLYREKRISISRGDL